MKKIFLTLLFIMTLFSISNINASHDCNKTINIDENWWNYSICWGLVNLEIPVWAVLSKTTLDINDYVKGDNINFLYSVMFENLGIWWAYDSWPGFLNFSLKDSNWNETNFKKWVKLIFKWDKNGQNIWVAFLKWNSFTFYKDNYKVLIENSWKSNESFTLSNINNYILDKNTYKIYLSDVTDINGTFSTANFLPWDLEVFTPLSSSEKEDVKNKLTKIEALLDRKDEILLYETALWYYHTFNQEEVTYKQYYMSKNYLTKNDKQRLDSFYNNLFYGFNLVYNDYQSLINSKTKNIDEWNIENITNNSYVNTNLNENNNSYAISRFEQDKSMINSSLEWQTFELEDIKNNTLKELNKINKNDDYLNQLKNKIKSYIDKKQTNLDNYKKTCNIDNIYSYYNSNNLEYVNTYLENNKCFNISNYFYNLEEENIKENNWKTIRELSSAYISNYYENSQNSIENNNNNENIEDIDKSVISNNIYQLNEKEKNAVNIVASKINKMSNIKNNKYKNLLNQYLSKFEYWSRKYEIVKGVLNLIK